MHVYLATKRVTVLILSNNLLTATQAFHHVRVIVVLHISLTLEYYPPSPLGNQ